MDHKQATLTMAAERYLLNQLPPDDRDAFEAHFFSCDECANDLRASAAFLQEAKIQLPEFNTTAPVYQQPPILVESHPRLPWWRPAVIIPAFIALLAILGYQSLVTVKAMNPHATQPRFLPRVALQSGNISDAPIHVAAKEGRGVVLLISLPQSAKSYAAYTINVQYPGNAPTWTRTLASSSASADLGQPLSLLIPAAGLEQGPYRLAVYGVTEHGQRALLDRSTLDVEFNKTPTHG